MEIEKFDPNSPGISNGCYFGLPFDTDNAELVLLSVGWDVTTSYGDGTAMAPDAIIDASLQVDLFDVHNPDGWKRGIATAETEEWIGQRNEKLREDARKVIAHLESGGDIEDDYVQRKLKRVNEGSMQINQHVFETAKAYLSEGHSVGLVGGDHSVPLGLIKALGEKYAEFGILHIDAHADLREAYEGFTYSHASIMYNVLEEVGSVKSLVQVGIRDFCDDENALAQNDSRIRMYNDYTIKNDIFKGRNWDEICSDIVSELPHEVYISFDIDGLTPDNSPHTGTPVPGGLTFHEAVYLINKVCESGRVIIGFDLCEVTPCEDNQWDANVGARILYKLCNFTLKTLF